MPASANQQVARNLNVTEARSLKIVAPGLAKLRRDFRRLAPEIDLALKGELRVALRPVVTTAEQLAPHRTGRLARALRLSVVQRGVAVVDRVPYGNVIHWGGSTGRGHRPGVPWSGSVFVRPSLFISRAIEQHEPLVMRAMGDAVDHAAVKAGWRNS